MTTRSICWGLLGAGLAFGQDLPNKTVAPSRTFTGTFSRKPRPIQRVLIQPQPEVCAAPLLEGKPAGDPNQWTMRVAKPREPLPRMPQLQPPAPACQ